MNKSESLILHQLAVCIPSEQYGTDLVNRSGGNLGMGSVYVYLGRLEDDGLVVSRRLENPNWLVPRRLYRLTEAGRRWLAREAGEPKVHNRHRGTAPPDAVYVGRGTPWGNPFHVSVGAKRKDVIQRFIAEVLPSLDVTALRGKHLVCSCAPLECHADSLLKKANE